jgi:hypothetical protein
VKWVPTFSVRCVLLDDQVFSFSIRGSSFFTKKLEPRILFFFKKQKPRNQTITIVYKIRGERFSSKNLNLEWTPKSIKTYASVLRNVHEINSTMLNQTNRRYDFIFEV